MKFVTWINQTWYRFKRFHEGQKLMAKLEAFPLKKENLPKNAEHIEMYLAEREFLMKQYFEYGDQLIKDFADSPKIQSRIRNTLIQARAEFGRIKKAEQAYLDSDEL